MERHGWGGAIEMAVFAKVRNARVQTYTVATSSGGDVSYKPGAGFGDRESPLQLNLLFQGGNHFDSLAPRRHGWSPVGHGRWSK